MIVLIADIQAVSIHQNIGENIRNKFIQDFFLYRSYVLVF
jgi:hypothetical protein